MIRRLMAIVLMISVTLAVTVMVMALAAQPPPLPKGHISIKAGAPTTLCFRCHKSPPALAAEKLSFCSTCHINIHLEETEFVDLARVAPRAKHPVEFNWASADCATCHTKPHKTKAAPHPVASVQPDSTFCQPCHANPTDPQKAIGGQEKAGEFCAACHHIGLQSTHVRAPDGVKVTFCFGCHKTSP